MQRMKYRIKFLTPAFLGNAEQSGQWRTPPFKALLRQWWRVVWAKRNGFPKDFAQMRLEEGRLFGNAWIEGDFRKSAVRMRLSKRCASPKLKEEGEGWTTGSLTRNQWGRQELDRKIRHPEVNQPVGPLLYLGYGPLKVETINKPGGTKEYPTCLKGNAAIQAGESVELSVSVPESEVADIRSALSLMSAYGTVGGRSRNGWGSFMIQPLDGSPDLDASEDTSGQGAGGIERSFVRSWRDALALDWPHAIGADDTGPLVWRTSESYDDWKAVMRDLAILKIGLRTMFVFPNTIPHTIPPHDRHWLSYPITKHNFQAWGNLRLPNTLRFKVRSDPGDPKRLRGVVFHVPCLPPADFKPNTRTIENVWWKTHQLLDELRLPSRQRRYTMIEDDVRRDALKPSLDRLTLERSPE